MKFLEFDDSDRRDAYLTASAELPHSSTVLEKDVWVCWALDALFSCEGLPHMAFKGGTSLSKVFGAIERFSEDIDVTMDCQELVDSIDPFAETSNKQRKRDDTTLRSQVNALSMDLVVPHLRRSLERAGVGSDALIVGSDGEELTINYPSALADRASYFREGVKIEFGGRNMTEPCERHELRPYLADAFSDLDLPIAHPDVLSPMRTFWEKVTLAHDESRRPQFRNAERMSRHWYDIAVLASHEIGRDALKDLDLLEDVVRVKTRFFNRASAGYELCLTGAAQLLPADEGLAMLRADYGQMVAHGMLERPLAFDAVIERVSALQTEMNELTA